MAMVTKSPLYEDGELVGIITVSSDATLFNRIESESLRTSKDRTYGQHRGWQLHSGRPLVAPVAQIASSVSNLVLMYNTTIRFFFHFDNRNCVVIIILLN